jgi:hypothetical protein
LACLLETPLSAYACGRPRWRQRAGLGILLPQAASKTHAARWPGHLPPCRLAAPHPAIVCGGRQVGGGHGALADGDSAHGDLVVGGDGHARASGLRGERVGSQAALQAALAPCRGAGLICGGMPSAKSHMS